MNCAMCPSWMGGGMVRGPVLGVLLVILLLVVIAAMSGRNRTIRRQQPPARLST